MPITKEQALSIAKNKLAREGGDSMIIREDKIVERDFGWVFFSTSREFMATSDPNKLIPGFGPLVVLKSNGHAEFISSSGSPDHAIERYEQIWQSRNQPG